MMNHGFGQLAATAANGPNPTEFRSLVTVSIIVRVSHILMDFSARKGFKRNATRGF